MFKKKIPIPHVRKVRPPLKIGKEYKHKVGEKIKAKKSEKKKDVNKKI
jgi:hypothetical protein